jgi:outer membrane protein W
MDSSGLRRLVRSRGFPGLRAAALCVVGAALTLVTTTAQGQDSGKGFFFGRPDGSLVIRGGLTMPNAGSDVFAQSIKDLTLGKNSFQAASIGLDLQMHASDRLDYTFGFDYAGSNTKSEFRNWVDNLNKPIEQFTELQRMPVTMSLKYYLVPNGRTIGRLAWVPAKFAPYIGAGGGWMWYQFRQNGDFIDMTTKNVFHDDFKSDGWTPTAQAFAGFDYSLSPRYALSTEMRYTAASATLGADYSGFNRIDLSGFATSVGVHVRF